MFPWTISCIYWQLLASVYFWRVEIFCSREQSEFWPNGTARWGCRNRHDHPIIQSHGFAPLCAKSCLFNSLILLSRICAWWYCYIRIWYIYIYISLRLPTPPMETPDPPSDTPGASKQVVLTPHDIPRSLRDIIKIIYVNSCRNGLPIPASFSNQANRGDTIPEVHLFITRNPQFDTIEIERKISGKTPGNTRFLTFLMWKEQQTIGFFVCFCNSDFFTFYNFYMTVQILILSSKVPWHMFKCIPSYLK